jgi:UDP-N-acetylmuramate: L-alanyl-gamma-D-glutamyl-meso-diaminopimelate ligase|tara:strand:+ start:24341 stop:25717 length:1377 start_codon:yes stop_codon:yes gene_type:complete
MGNAALLLREAGHDVLGSDQNAYPPMSRILTEAGIEVLPGFDPQRLAELAPDLVVIGNVNARGNPEIEWLLDTRSIPFISLPEALNRFVLSGRRNIVVAGTHGKTTTTALTAFILRSIGGANPGWLVGGAPNDLPSGYALGDKAAPFVIEGDEYDSAFFDKRSKFIHYAPQIAVLNNLEFDHADIFRDLADIKRTFNHFLRIIPRRGWILYNGDDENLCDLLPVAWSRSLKIGTGADNDLQILSFKENAKGSSFQLSWRGTVWAKVNWPLMGLYNARNAAMALLAAGLAINEDDPFCKLNPDVLKNYRGVERRQEILYQDNGTVVISDFGHHPTAIKGTLESLRNRYPNHRLTMAWEARSNTACRNVLQAAFADAFSLADTVHLGAVFRAERYTDEERIDLAAIAHSLESKATVYPDNKTLQSGLLQSLEKEPKQCVVFFSNGSFDGIIGQTVEALKA